MKIVNCTCTNAYQDNLYGKNKRAANDCAAEGKYRCTVCGKDTSGITSKKK